MKLIELMDCYCSKEGKKISRGKTINICFKGCPYLVLKPNGAKKFIELSSLKCHKTS